MAKKKRTKEEQIRHRRTVRRKVTGGVTLLLAFIGIVSVLVTVGKQVYSLVTNSNMIDEFESQIEFVVALDPSPFVITENPNDDLLLEAAIYQSLGSYPAANLQYDEEGRLLLPALEVSTAAASMYGGGYTVEHHTFSDVSLSFVYDSETGLYTLPDTSGTVAFYPKVTKVAREGSNRVLTVAYMSPGLIEHYTGKRDPEHDTVVKHMEYVMAREEGQWLLVEVRASALS